MQVSRTIKGVIPVVQTPLNKDESVDVPALRRLIEFLVSKKVGGFWALGTGSEDMNLSYKKRLLVAQTVAEANAGRLPLVMGAGFFALEDILSFINDVRDLQFDAYHVMPYHPLLGLDRMEWFYKRIADAAPKPLWMYTSANWCRAFTPEFVTKLKSHPNIAGIKFSNSKTTEQIRVLALQEPGFQIITAVASQFYACLSMGSQAGTTSLASALPEPLLEIYALFSAGKHAEALAAQRKLTAFLADMPKTAKNHNFLTAAEEKYMLSRRGICQIFTTSYYAGLEPADQKLVDAALEKHGYSQYVVPAS